ncbi:hypothetical protein [Idiomarina seosinensis]|uniref:Uncharacterized protein n=1 Tax=Idiomarina seosinensis TaxID=281739 RepID=A0A432ZJ46_9GAMM|nr:hypothetical protein [Idiomarina seosinensis]RUO78037.1 hypothetical protein CWI81_06100 [Idiomarina seosinensis]
MANFDAMVPLIPRETRIPIDHDRDQWRINQVEKTEEMKKISDDEGNTITANEDRQRKQQQQQQQQHSSADADEDNDGHIDTYA